MLPRKQAEWPHQFKRCQKSLINSPFSINNQGMQLSLWLLWGAYF